jgi:hypothetical protein
MPRRLAIRDKISGPITLAWKRSKMDEQTIINQAVDTYHRLDGILRSPMLKDEEAIVRLLKSPVDTKPETVGVVRVIRVNLN